MSGFLTQYAKNIEEGYFLGRLYQISWFPGAVFTGVASEKVFGTVFQVQHMSLVLKTLDAYEGFDEKRLESSLFVRQLITVYLENNRPLKAWVYLYNQTVKGKRRIDSGYFIE